MFLLLLFLFVCVFIFCMCVNLLLILSWFLECHSDHQVDCLHQFIFVCVVNAFQFAIQISAPAACALWQERGYIVYNLPGRVSKTGCNNQKHSFL